MPHEWWHKDVVDRGWDAFKEYAMPLGQRALQESLEFSPIPKQVPVVGGFGLEEVLKGVEFVHERGMKPWMSGFTEFLPVSWEDTPQSQEAAWYDPKGRYQGKWDWNLDAYRKPDGSVSPSALLDLATTASTGGLKNVFGEFINVPTSAKDTVRAQRIDEVARQREAETGVPLSERERREIGEDIYKLPPYVRGLTEELPYLAIPPARVARTALQGARAGQALSTAGRLGAAAPVARGALRGAEMALKPVELLERGAERVITAPFRGIGAVGRGVGSQVGASRARAETRRAAQEMPTVPEDPFVRKVPRVLSPEERYSVKPPHLRTPEEIAAVAKRAEVDMPVPEGQGQEVIMGGPARQPSAVARETTVGISATVEPDQGFTKYFSAEDHDDWVRAKEILGKAYKYEDAPLLNWRNLEWSQETIDRLSIAGRNRVSQKLTDDGFEAVVESNSGLFGGVVEPSIVIRASVPDNQLDDFTRTVVDLADTEFNQRNVIVHSVEPDLSPTYGRTNNASTIGETLEPAVSIRLSRPLTQQEIQKYGLRYVDIEKEIGLSGYGGFAVHPDRQGLDILNLTVYNDDYPKYAATVKRFVGELINDGIGTGQTLERTTRRVRTIGEGRDGITSYADYRGHHDAQRGPTSRFRDEPAPAERATAESVEPRAPPQRQASGPDASVEELAPSLPEEIPAPRMRVENVAQDQGTARAAVMGMQPQQLQQRRASRPSVGHQEAEQAIGGRLSRLRDKLGNDYADRIAAGMKARFPNIADKYVAFIADAWDSGFGLRILEDYAWRSANPNALFNPLARMAVPVADRLVRATGAAVGKGHARYVNFMRDQIEPLLARGATPEAIERVIQARHWSVLAAKFEGRGVPSIVDPANPTKKIKVDSADLANWTDREWIRRNTIKGVTLSDDALDAIEEGASAIRDVYREQRGRMLREGLIDQERFDYWQREYEWYNPIQYQEFADQGNISDMYRGLNGGLSDNGIRKLTDDSVEALGALPPLGEVMLKNLIATELRLTRNSITKKAVIMGLDTEIGLKDVSSKFVRKVKRKDADGNLIKDENGRAIDDIELMPVPYAEETASGFISYYHNGQRFVYGSTEGSTAPKWFWDVLNGRSGLALRGDKEIDAALGAANGFFRSMYTTYNPLFFVRNGLIDMFTVFLKAGVLPPVTAQRVMKSLWNAARNNEDRMMELMQLSGGYSDRFYDVDANLRKITEQIRTAGTRQDATTINPKDVTGKTLNKYLKNAVNPNTSITGKLKRIIPATGSAIEQSPRLAVTEKALKKYIGKDEFKRLMKLDSKSFNDEMLNNWKKTGVGLVDTDEMQRAAQNGVEATLDFSRGGDAIRRWNNYILFLNAAMEGFKLPFRTMGWNLHPVIRPVRNPVEGGPKFEFGSLSEQMKNMLPFRGNRIQQGRGVTGRVFDGVNGGPRNAAMIIGSMVATYWGIQNYWNKQFTYEGTPLYYDIPTYVRYNSLIFMLPPDKDENGDLVLDPKTGRPVPKYLVIPHRLREWNLIFQSATLLDEETDKDVPMDKSKLAWEVFKSTSPVSDLPMPELINVGMEEWTGYDFFRNAPIVDEELQGGELEEQYNQWTSESARKAAGILDELPAPDLIGDVIGSPQRLDHLYENITGGAGKLVTSFADYMFRVVDELRDIEQRPMTEKVEEYRDMDRTRRMEFRASLTEEEYEEFDREIRMPKKEIPFWDAMIKSFYPEKGGGLFELSQAQTEEIFPDVSAEDTRKAGRLMGKVRQQLKYQQNKDDLQLQSWVKQGIGAKLSPKEWRGEKSDRWNKYEGAEIASTQIYQQSIRGQSDEVREAYYDSLYTAAGKMGDIRVGADLLLAGYYAIEPSDSTEDGVNNTDWTDFFAERERYIESIRLSSEAAGDNMHQEVMDRLQANMTPTEKAYDNSRKLLAPYWNAGRNVQELFPNASPQFQQAWDSYLNADSGRRNALYNGNPVIKSLVERRSQLRKQILLRDAQQNGYPNMELALVFWYGDFYDNPLTPQAKAYYNNLYGRASNISGFVPTAPVQAPVQGPQLPVGAR